MITFDSDSVEIADAAHRAAIDPSKRGSEFLAILDRKKPTAATLANALAYLAIHAQGTWGDAAQSMVNTYLQVQLTREHVHAQERMSNSATFLTAASVFLAIVSLVVAMA